MDYPDSVEYLYSLGNESKTLKLDLEAMAVLLEALGNPQRAFHSVHVAGTNGKGSTSAMIEAGLRAAGVRTGLYTSPHLVEPTERIQVAGRSGNARAIRRRFPEGPPGGGRTTGRGQARSASFLFRYCDRDGVPSLPGSACGHGRY